VQRAITNVPFGTVANAKAFLDKVYIIVLRLARRR
jgi:hypothetical protein